MREVGAESGDLFTDVGLGSRADDLLRDEPLIRGKLATNLSHPLVQAALQLRAPLGRSAGKTLDQKAEGRLAPIEIHAQVIALSRTHGIEIGQRPLQGSFYARA